MDTSSLKDTPELMARRKQSHIDICALEDVESKGSPFEKVRLRPCALPEFRSQDVDTAAHFLGRRFAMPVLVTGMTGGVEKGQSINLALAEAASEMGIPMGLGSQKMMIANPDFRSLFDVKTQFPKLFVIGNIGAVSLNYGYSVDDILRLVDDLKLDAFALHVNALQECIQPEGERDFSHLIPRIAELVRRLPVPLVIKEVGSGLDAETLTRLAGVGVKAFDLGGAGGTSWSRIEGLRSPPQSRARRLGDLFRNWGYTTEESLIKCAPVAGKQGLELVATGGIRDGLQVAKAVALGAKACGVGLPLFRAALAEKDPCQAVWEELKFFQEGLAVAMFCSGSKRLEDLSQCVL